jgi:non-canonical purine NTP pyrophosphatase (RdgB/HAM1 family)
MDSLVFITGNRHKAEYVGRFLGSAITHQKIELDEIQSLDLHEIVRHKLRQAYALVGKPVVVEDVSLEFHALGRLPGPFIRWFIDELGTEKTTALLEGKDRAATVRCVVGYADGEDEVFFEGSAEGSIGDVPQKGIGYGFDEIFIQAPHTVPRSLLSQEDHDRTHFEFKPYAKLREYLSRKTS